MLKEKYATVADGNSKAKSMSSPAAHVARNLRSTFMSVNKDPLGDASSIPLRIHYNNTHSHSFNLSHSTHTHAHTLPFFMSDVCIDPQLRRVGVRCGSGGGGVDAEARVDIHTSSCSVSG